MSKRTWIRSSLLMLTVVTVGIVTGFAHAQEADSDSNLSAVKDGARLGKAIKYKGAAVDDSGIDTYQRGINYHVFMDHSYNAFKPWAGYQPNIYDVRNFENTLLRDDKKIKGNDGRYVKLGKLRFAATRGKEIKN